MTTWDQRHGLDACRALQRRGFEDVELLQAALIHDCGKAAAPIRLWHRVGAVLIKALAPELWWSRFRAAPGSWRYALYVYREHPVLGAQMAREAGCSARVAWLIRSHEETRWEGDGGLKALKRADREA